MGTNKATATQVGREAAERVRASMATNDLAQRAREAAYTIVGLGVMGAQRAAVASKQAARQLRSDDASSKAGGVNVTIKGIDVDQLRAKTKGATDSARQQFSKVDEVLAGALARIDEAMAPLEERLPAAAKDTVLKMKEASKGLHAQLHTYVAQPPAPEAVGPAKSRKRTAVSESTSETDAA